MGKGIDMQGEFAMPTTDRFIVVPGGDGIITPTGLYVDAECAQEVDNTQAEVQDPHVVCGDERHALEVQPVRPKLFGGNTVTGMAAAAYSRWSFFTPDQIAAGPMAMYDAVFDHMARTGAAIGGHGGHAPCGASANFVAITQVSAEIGESDFVLEQMAEDLQDLFDESVLAEVANGAARFSRHPKLSLWLPSHVEERIKQEGVLEELTDKNLHPDVDPDNQRHGHFAELWNINHDKNKSNDRDKSKIPYFQVDIPALTDEAQRLAGDDKEFVRLMHAGMLFQYATGFKLTKNMRVSRTGLVVPQK